MELIKIDRGRIAGGIPDELIIASLDTHRLNVPKYEKLRRYYRGAHMIEERRQDGPLAPNNRLVNNFPKYITDTVCGYVFGNSITLTAADDTTDISPVADALSAADAGTYNAELGKILSVYGLGYELWYMDDTATPRMATVEPRHAFLVYSDDVREQPLFGVTYRRQNPRQAPMGEYDATYHLYLYTDTEVREYTLENGALIMTGSAPHYFGHIPLIEYWNNEDGMGDFEHVLTLIDAYNTLQSDRVNDKERFVSAILMIRGATLGEDSETAAAILKNSILELPEKDADAAYLIKSMDESQVEILRRSLADDIHKFSQVPDFTDQQFTGNSSGVAIKYKLMSLECLANIKERYFTSGLKERLALVANIIAVKGGPVIDPASVQITFHRTLPANELETMQMVTMGKTAGVISLPTAVKELNLAADTGAEVAAIQREAADKQAATAATFGVPGPQDLVM